MSVLPVCLYGASILRRKTAPVKLPAERPAAARLIRDLFDTMAAKGGVGLAANQVGSGMRVAVIQIPPREGPGVRLVLVNPEITAASGRQAGEEGCLSFPGLFLTIKRSEKVTVRALNERGLPVEIQSEGFLARALQHEIDHLNGVMFVDRLSFLKRLKVKPLLARLKREWAKLNKNANS